MQIKVIENFLEDKLFNEVKNQFIEIPWYFCDHTTDKKDTSNFMFNHTLFMNNKVLSDKYFNSILIPIIGKLNFNYLLRAKLNLYTKRNKHIKSTYHVDFEQKHTVCLFSFNTNNGYTEFKKGAKIKSKQNTMIIFPGDLEHRSVNQTDTDTRINLNIDVI